MANSDGSSILWFLAGVGIGTAVGILYAPRSGSETREVLRAKVDDGFEPKLIHTVRGMGYVLQTPEAD